MTANRDNETPGTTQEFHDLAPLSLKAAGHQMTVLSSGRDRFDALIDLIDAAQSRIDMAFYIFDRDQSGRAVRDALIAAVERGVAVRLIVDGFGANDDPTFFGKLRKAGGKAYLFSPKWSRRYLIRNHQKIVLIDGERAIVGGFNVADDYFAPPGENGWNDLGMMISGDAVGRLGEWFDALEKWVSDPKAQWLAIRRAVREWTPRDAPVQVLIGGPTATLSSWARAVRQDLNQARQLDMIMAYFSPSSGLLRRIARVAKRGRARLVMAGKSDNGATIGATRALYTYLLKHNVEVSEFSVCKLHTKLIVVDDVTYIGSANFDMRSLYLNLEVMLRIEDKGLADAMRDHVAHHAEASDAVTLESHRKKAGLFNRIRWNFAWFLVSVVDYTVSRRLNLGL